MYDSMTAIIEEVSVIFVYLQRKGFVNVLLLSATCFTTTQ